MSRRKIATTFRLLLTIGLAITFAHPAFAEEAADAPAGATKPMGPGGPTGRSKPASEKTAKAAPAAKAAPVTSGIQLSRRTTVASSVNVHDKVLQECDIETMLPQMIAEKNSDVTLVDAARAGTQLELKIVDIHAPNGGVFSGPKWITVEGKLVSGKTVKGDFTAKESSMASATACGMLHKVMLVMAEDIATWLRNPSRDAHLGRAR